MTNSPSEILKRTALFDLHVELGAKMVPFAGYEMPVRYGDGIIAEHLHTRLRASLFDVSHMGQVALKGADAAAAIEALVPGEIQGLEPRAMRYTVFTNPSGGILDDLIVINGEDRLLMVVNAAGKDQDLAHLSGHLAGRCEVTALDDRALLALQGPAAAKVLSRFAPDCRRLSFMTAARFSIDGTECLVARSGYTGEDGFEISVPDEKATELARLLLGEPEVMPAGLGARDTLRLEAGLCLYGHDIDTGTTPVEAGLAWTIGKRRRAQADFPGADVILRQLEQGVERRRVGIRPEDRAPAREHTQVTDAGGAPVGAITSGGFGPTVGGPIAMGYVKADHAEPGTMVNLLVRGVPRPARIVSLPFVEPRYCRGG